MEGIVICDLKFFRDIYEIGLLDKVFCLPVVFHTSDFVYDNLVPDGCMQKCREYREQDRLIVDTIPGKELDNILDLRMKGLSFDDATVWYISRKFGFKLLTDDFLLGQYLREDSKEVLGILDVLKMLISNNLIRKECAAEKLDELKNWGREFSKEEINSII